MPKKEVKEVKGSEPTMASVERVPPYDSIYEMWTSEASARREAEDRLEDELRRGELYDVAIFRRPHRDLFLSCIKYGSVRGVDFEREFGKTVQRALEKLVRLDLLEVQQGRYYPTHQGREIAKQWKVEKYL